MTRRDSLALARAARTRSFLGLQVALLLAAAASVHANPSPGRREDAIMAVNALPRAIAVLGTPGRRARFVELLSQRRFALLRPGTLEFIHQRFGVFEPLFIASQSAGRGLDLDLQKDFRKWANPAGREAMNQALRGWLTAPGPPPTIPGLIHVDYPPGTGHGVSPDERVRAAEMLGDVQDTGALPALETLARSPDLSGGQKWYVEQAMRRLRDPDSAAFLVLDARGRSRCCRGLADVESLQVRRSGPQGQWTMRVLDPQVAPGLWSQVSRENRAWRRTWHEAHIDEVRIRFRSGLVATLNANSVRSVTYTDNGRVDGNALVLENSELFGILEGVVAWSRSTAPDSMEAR